MVVKENIKQKDIAKAHWERLYTTGDVKADIPFQKIMLVIKITTVMFVML